MSSDLGKLRELSVPMNFNHLHYFNVIATEGSLSKAARKLRLSQPTLSTQLKQLEEYFGAKLFDRSGASMRLNESGKQALLITEEMFRLGEKLDELFGNASHEPRMRLEVGITGSVSRTLAVEKLVRLLGNQRVVTRLRHGDHEFLYHELLTGGLDLLLSDSLPHRKSGHGVACRKISSPGFVIIAPGGKAGAEGEDLAEILGGHPFIHYTPHNSYRFEIDLFFRTQGIVPHIVAEADDVYLILAAVEKGVGAGVVPASLVGAEGRAKVRVLGTINEEFPVHAIYQKKDPSEEILHALTILGGEKD